MCGSPWEILLNKQRLRFASWWNQHAHEEAIPWKCVPHFWPWLRDRWVCRKLDKGPVMQSMNFLCDAGLNKLSIYSLFRHAKILMWRRGVDVFFDLCMNTRSSKQLWSWWFETPSRHCDLTVMLALCVVSSILTWHQGAVSVMLPWVENKAQSILIS